MAKTAEQIIDYKLSGDQIALPVASGETIYKGTFACVDDDGYLRNLSSTYTPQAKMVVFVADGSANATGPAATTSAGSISGSLEKASDDAGDKTVRRCYTNGHFLVTFTSITQANVGKTVYATDNYTVDEAQNSGVKVGTLVTYLSATSGWIELNKFYQHDGTVFYKTALTASSGNAGMLNLLNPAGATIMIDRAVVDISAASSTALTFDLGVGASGASADTLIDGQATSVAGVFNNLNDAGTNGGMDKATSAEYITCTSSGAMAATAFAGTIGIYYRYWE